MHKSRDAKQNCVNRIPLSRYRKAPMRSFSPLCHHVNHKLGTTEGHIRITQAVSSTLADRARANDVKVQTEKDQSSPLHRQTISQLRFSNQKVKTIQTLHIRGSRCKHCAMTIYLQIL